MWPLSSICRDAASGCSWRLGCSPVHRLKSFCVAQRLAWKREVGLFVVKCSRSNEGGRFGTEQRRRLIGRWNWVMSASSPDRYLWSGRSYPGLMPRAPSRDRGRQNTGNVRHPTLGIKCGSETRKQTNSCGGLFMSANSLRSGLVVISKEPSRARRARSGIEELLRQIMTERGPAVTSPVILRDRFEDALRSLVSVPVRLCDAPRGGLSPDDSALAERMRVAVPVPPGRPPVALELAPQDGARLGEREVRFLELAALVAGLILVGGSESATRQGLPPVGETKLVGSSAAMGDVRRRIDQVANADIAVLIEGETGTQ